MARVPIPQDAGRSISQEPGGKAIGHVLFPFSKRQLVNACEDYVVPDVVNAWTFLTGQAGRIVGRDGFAAANCAEVDGMGKSLLGADRPAPRNLAIERQQQAVIAAGPGICLKGDGSKSLPCGGINKIVQGTNAGADCAGGRMKLRRVAQVLVIAGEDMHTVRPQLGNGEQEILRQGLLDGKTPGLDVEVGMVTDQSARDELRLTSSACGEIKIGRILQIAGLEECIVLDEARLPNHELILGAVAFQSRVAVVILGCSMVDSEAASNNSFPFKPLGRPSHAQARVEILVVGAFKRGSWGTESMASSEVEYFHAVVRFGNGSVVIPTQPGVDGQVRSYFPLVLDVWHDKSAAQSVPVPGSGVIDEVYLIVDEGCFVTRSSLHLDRQGCRFPLIQLDSPDLDARFHRVAALSPGQIVEVGIGGSNLIVCLAVVEWLKICGREADINESR